jgi:hypothetical protein
VAQRGDARRVSRLSRLSARDLRRLTPKQRAAVDVLRYARPDAAGRGEAKTVLGWRRTSEEAAAYARKLIANGMMPGAAALRLGVDPDHLRRLLNKVPDPEKRPRNRSIHAENSGLTDKDRPAPLPPSVGPSGLTDNPDGNRPTYAGDPLAYDVEAALRRASPK